VVVGAVVVVVIVVFVVELGTVVLFTVIGTVVVVEVIAVVGTVVVVVEVVVVGTVVVVVEVVVVGTVLVVVLRDFSSFNFSCSIASDFGALSFTVVFVGVSDFACFGVGISAVSVLFDDFSANSISVVCCLATIADSLRLLLLSPFGFTGPSFVFVVVFLFSPKYLNSVLAVVGDRIMTKTGELVDHKVE